MEKRPMAGNRNGVYGFMNNPLIKHLVAVLRDERTPSDIFKYVMADLGRFLLYEASKGALSSVAVHVKSPMGVASVEILDPRGSIAIVPILRAGLILAEHAASVFPGTKTYHLGISKDKERREPNVYLNKLPEKFPKGSRVFVIDPMVATGDTVVAAIELIKARGVGNTNIKVISVIVAREALGLLRQKFIGLEVYAGAFDEEEVNDDGFIIPGLGDAAERCFGT